MDCAKACVLKEEIHWVMRGEGIIKKVPFQPGYSISVPFSCYRKRTRRDVQTYDLHPRLLPGVRIMPRPTTWNQNSADTQMLKLSPLQQVDEGRSRLTEIPRSISFPV